MGGGLERVPRSWLFRHQYQTLFILHSCSIRHSIKYARLTTANVVSWAPCLYSHQMHYKGSQPPWQIFVQFSASAREILLSGQNRTFLFAVSRTKLNCLITFCRHVVFCEAVSETTVTFLNLTLTYKKIQKQKHNFFIVAHLPSSKI